MSYTNESISKMLSKATAGYKHTKKLMKRLEQLKPHKLDQIFHNLHEKEYAKINCLECANYCKTISPSLYDSDVRHMASAIGLKVTEFLIMMNK